MPKSIQSHTWIGTCFQDSPHAVQEWAAPVSGAVSARASARPSAQPLVMPWERESAIESAPLSGSALAAAEGTRAKSAA